VDRKTSLLSHVQYPVPYQSRLRIASTTSRSSTAFDIVTNCTYHQSISSRHHSIRYKQRSIFSFYSYIVHQRCGRDFLFYALHQPHPEALPPLILSQIAHTINPHHPDIILFATNKDRSSLFTHILYINGAVGTFSSTHCINHIQKLYRL
jgi:hypothetical protein